MDSVDHDLDEWNQALNNTLVRPQPIPPYALLIGAGFTAGIGGFLAQQMWEQIFNEHEISSSDILRERMLENFNFEEIYESLIADGKKDLVATFSRAINTAYDRLDRIVRRAHQEPVQLNDLGSWLGRFGGQSFTDDHKGFLFSLNQDLFIERMRRHAGLDTKIPGMPPAGQVQTIADHDGIRKVRIPKYVQPLQLSQELGRLNLIKLHGSCNWIDADDQEIMVIGGRKVSSIRRHNLLSSYFSLFKYVLNRPDMNLWVFGYSFADEHVNSAIINALQSNPTLKLFVVDLARPDEFMKRFKSNELKPIKRAIRAYIPNSIRGIFQAGYTSVPYQQIDSLMYRQQYKG